MLGRCNSWKHYPPDRPDQGKCKDMLSHLKRGDFSFCFFCVFTVQLYVTLSPWNKCFIWEKEEHDNNDDDDDDDDDVMVVEEKAGDGEALELPLACDLWLCPAIFGHDFDNDDHHDHDGDANNDDHSYDVCDSTKLPHHFWSDSTSTLYFGMMRLTEML